MIDSPVPFADAELFFSRTDTHGVIRAGNTVFRRVSGFDWDELIGRPHQIVRHPHMPRGVFWLLWDTIQRGEPIGAYVKNRAKDGRYYWVFAIVTPVEGGFLSVRLRPESAIFALVEREYAALAVREAGEELAPADSAALLLARLHALGFPDYSTFAAAALTEELLARAPRMNARADDRLRAFPQLQGAANRLRDQAMAISASHHRYTTIPVNLQIQSATLGGAGAPLAAIARYYQMIAERMKAAMDSFCGAAAEVQRSVAQGMFLTGVALVQAEMSALFREEGDGDGTTDLAAERALLDAQSRQYERLSLDGLIAISRQAERFRSICADMDRLTAGVQVTAVMAEIETAGVAGGRQRLAGLLTELKGFQTSLADAFTALSQHSREVKDRSAALLQAAA